MRQYGVLVVSAEFVEKVDQAVAELGTHVLEHQVYSLCQQVVYFCSVRVLTCGIKTNHFAAVFINSCFIIWQKVGL